MKSNFLTLLALSYIVVRLVFTSIYVDWNVPDYSLLESKYRSSQYCLIGLRDQFGLDELSSSTAKECGDGLEFGGNIDDPELYTYAGYRYVRGVDPAGINFELQPLTKYLFGIASMLSISPLVVQWILVGIIMLIIYHFGKELGLASFTALLPLALLVSDGLVLEQLSRAYLDLSQTTFILLSIYLLNKALKNKSSFIYLAISLALVALSKSFSIGILLAGASFLVVLVISRDRVVEFLRSLIFAIITYLFGYIAFFADSSVFGAGFLRLHVTILKLYKNYVPEYPMGEIWRIITTGDWRIWWGDKGLIKVSEWSLLWPAGAISSFALGIQGLKKRSPLLVVSFSWVIIYLIFVSMRLVFPRYLLQVLPLLYLLLAYQLSFLLQKLTKKLS